MQPIVEMLAKLVAGSVYERGMQVEVAGVSREGLTRHQSGELLVHRLDHVAVLGLVVGRQQGLQDHGGFRLPLVHRRQHGLDPGEHALGHRSFGGPSVIDANHENDKFRVQPRCIEMAETASRLGQ